jgi:F420-non-reducing hydrogenase iron-sulfur subunit
MSEANESEPGSAFEPRIVAFFCNWCTYTASDVAGIARLKYPSNIRVIRLMCSGRLDPQFVLAALRGGADGVLIGGCHPGDCHYQEGNYKCLRRVQLLKRLLAQLGIDERRLRLEWISASEGDRLRDVVYDMVAELRRLGPLQLDDVPHRDADESRNEQPVALPVEGASS